MAKYDTLSDTQTVDDGRERGGRDHPKNTRKWCRGKVGVEHVTELTIPANASNADCSATEYDARSPWSEFGFEVGCSHVEQCVKCGKHVRSFLNKGECPSRESATAQH